MPSSLPGPRRTVVVGAGIAGLAAAREPRRGRPRPSWCSRARPASAASCSPARSRASGRRRRRGDARPPPRGASTSPASSGLPVVHPATTVVRGSGPAARCARCRRSLMGVPARPGRRSPRSGILARRRAGPAARRGPGRALADGEDVSVGDLVAARLGDEVVDRLVEPLLGGVYAGHARLLVRAGDRARSWSAWSGDASLVGDAAAHAGPADGRPVFAGPRRRRGPAARGPGAPGSTVRTDVTVRELRRTPTGFALVVGPTTAAEEVLGRRGRARHAGRARPPGCSPTVAPAAAARAGRRSSTRRWRSSRSPSAAADARRAAGLRLPGAAGRRPHDQGRRRSRSPSGTGSATAGAGLLRAADLGRPARRGGGPAARRRRPGRRLAGRPAPRRPASPRGPSTRHVQRWGGGLPQYAVGHLDRVAPHPRGRRRGAGAGGLRRGVRRRRHPGLHRRRPAGGRPPTLDAGSNEGMTDAQDEATTKAARTREINDTIRYTMWSVFRLATAYGAGRPRRRGRRRGRGAARRAGARRTSSCAGSYDVAGCAPTPT